MAPPDPSPKLTPAQHELVASVSALARHFAHKAPLPTRRFFGLDDLYQEMFLAACRSAQTFNPGLNIKFVTYAYRAMWMRLANLSRVSAHRGPVWYEWPELMNGGSADPLDVPDGRPAPRPTPLARWCAASDCRRNVHPRHRVLLYLRCVEGWQFQEIGDYFGVSVERVRQMCDKAREIIQRGVPKTLSP